VPRRECRLPPELWILVLENIMVHIPPVWAVGGNPDLDSLYVWAISKDLYAAAKTVFFRKAKLVLSPKLLSGLLSKAPAIAGLITKITLEIWDVKSCNCKQDSTEPAPDLTSLSRHLGELKSLRQLHFILAPSLLALWAAEVLGGKGTFESPYHLQVVRFKRHCGFDGYMKQDCKRCRKIKRRHTDILLSPTVEAYLLPGNKSDG
jgi:hypothetical protein